MRKNERRGGPGLPLPELTETFSGKETEENVPLLLWRVETLAFDAAPGKSGAASFYADLAARTKRYLSGSLTDLLRAEYLRSDPARRRFTFRCAVYSHSTRVEKGDGDVTVVRSVALTRAGRVLLRRVFREVWDVGGKSLLSATEDGRNPDRRPEKPAKKSRKKG